MTVRTIHGDSAVYLATESLIKTLFANDENRLVGWVDRMIAKHREARGPDGGNTYAFIYDGTIYRQSNVAGRIDGAKMLAPTIHAEMDAFLKDKAIIDDERAFVRQMLVALFDPCTGLQDMRDALPECLVSCLPELQGYTRQREPAYTIQANPRAMRQYAKILPKIEAYAAARLMF